MHVSGMFMQKQYIDPIKQDIDPIKQDIDPIKQDIDPINDPIKDIVAEVAAFDTQKMQNPEISGVEYQQGTFLGYMIREYLAEKFDRDMLLPLTEVVGAGQ